MTGIGIQRRDGPGCTLCVLATVDGNAVRLEPLPQAPADDLTVCALGLSIDAAATPAVEWQPLTLEAPVAVTVLETETWLDPQVFCRPTFGDASTLRCQGPPGSASPGATASCRYAGGVELVDAAGRNLFIATASQPCRLHVSGITEDSAVARRNFARADVGTQEAGAP